MSYNGQTLSPLGVDRLQAELLLCCGRKGKYHEFIDAKGETIQGATETDVRKHLTSSRDYFEGRQFLFPGLSTSWEFYKAIEAAGFRSVRARNFRNQECNVITL